MLKHALYYSNAFSFCLKVKIVGVIREVQESVTNLLYKIDDMTGDSLIVRRWIDNDVRILNLLMN